MSDKFLCVLAGYDDDTNAHLQGLQDALYAKGFVGTQTKDFLQHITIGKFNLDFEDKLIDMMTRVAGETHKFDVSLSHIGMFAGGKVLFIAPDINRNLLALEENFGESYGWVPHSTMLIDESPVIHDAISTLTDVFTPFCGTITSLHLYEFFPSRHIFSVALND